MAGRYAARVYPLLFSHVLRRIPAESAHRLATAALRLLGPLPARPDAALRVEALGLTFASPLGAAAGIDKEARCFRGLLALGFGFVEVGTLTAEPQPGNPRPRVWRLVEERALVNAMGFPNPGAARAAARLGARRGPVGVNIGKSQRAPLESAAADYRASVRALAPHADFVVLNVSSPNTARLRELQAVEQLRELVSAVRAETERPVLVKLAPDLSDDELDAVADFAVESGVAGLVATNTTTSRAGLASDPGHPGGLSGAPLKARSLAVLRRLYARVGDALVLVSVGGVETADDVWERVLAGATLVQGYTGFVYGGPLWPRRINAELAARARAAGAATIQDLVGHEVGVRAGLARRAPASGAARN